MSIRTTKKFGFFSALAMVVGAVVGIGIFIKNGSIFEITGGNSIAILLAWIIGGVVALMSALSFAEITKSDVSTNGGLGQYARIYVSKKFSYFIRVTYPLVYFAVLQIALGYFTYIFFANAFGDGTISLSGVAVVVFVAVPLSSVMNAYMPNGIKGLMGMSLIIKFIPLLLAALIGLWFTSNGGGIGKVLSANTKEAGTFVGILTALPAVLFSFDAFVGVGSIAKDTRNAERTIPLAVAFGMIFVTIIYILITISQINQNEGTVSGTISQVLNTNALSKIIDVIIVISALGTYSAITTSYVNATQDAIEQNILPFSIVIKEKWGNKSGAWFTVAWSFLFSIPLMLIYVVSNVDIIDGMSNMPTLFFMIFYSVVFLGFVINKIKNKQVGKKRIYLITIGIIASSSIMFIVSYQFYELIKDFVFLIKDGPGLDASGKRLEMGKEVVKRIPLIIFPLILYLVPWTLSFIKNRYEYKNTIWNSIKKACKFLY